MSWFKQQEKTKRVTVAGKTLLCGCCGCSEFITSEVQLHSQGMTFLKLEWLGPSAHVLICSNCSRIEWFAKKPEELTSA